MRFSEPYQAPVFDPGIDLDLSRNEGRPIDPAIIDDIAIQPGIFNRYPDATEFRERIASLRRVRPEQVLVTAGGDDALLRCCSALIEPGVRTVTTTPTFEMIPRYAGLQGADLVEVPWRNRAFPVEGVAGESRPGAVALVVSPNNPTGEVITTDDLAALAGAFEYVVLDGAYTEFADMDLTDVALGLPNVLMIRTLSKAWGLAGLRVGYLLASPDLVRLVAAHGSPYPVSRLSLAIAIERLLGNDGFASYVDRVRAERGALTSLLDDLGLEPIRSQANFVYAESEEADRVQSDLASLGIAIRTFPGRPELEHAIRVTLPGDTADYDRLAASLATVVTTSTRRTESTS